MEVSWEGNTLLKLIAPRGTEFRLDMYGPSVKFKGLYEGRPQFVSPRPAKYQVEIAPAQVGRGKLW